METLFLQNIRAINDYYRLQYTISYWRTSNGLEVDFILYGEHGFYAFEIKHSAKVDNIKLSGIKAFLREYPTAKPYIIYRGKQHYHIDGITFLPIEHALLNLQKLITRSA